MTKHILKIKDDESTLWLDMRKVEHVKLYYWNRGINDDGERCISMNIDYTDGNCYGLGWAIEHEHTVQTIKDTIEAYVDKQHTKGCIRRWLSI